MICSLYDLRDKEVINIQNGEKLGYIDDIEVESEKGEVIAFVIFGRHRLWGLLGRDEDIVITCSQIKLIGRDTVLVSLNEDTCAKRTKIKRFSTEKL